jgi:hypothetical protein
MKKTFAIAYLVGAALSMASWGAWAQNEPRWKVKVFDDSGQVLFDGEVGEKSQSFKSNPGKYARPACSAAKPEDEAICKDFYAKGPRSEAWMELAVDEGWLSFKEYVLAGYEIFDSNQLTIVLPVVSWGKAIAPHLLPQEAGRVVHLDFTAWLGGKVMIDEPKYPTYKLQIVKVR